MHLRLQAREQCRRSSAPSSCSTRSGRRRSARSSGGPVRAGGGSAMRAGRRQSGFSLLSGCWLFAVSRFLMPLLLVLLALSALLAVVVLALGAACPPTPARTAEPAQTVPSAAHLGLDLREDGVVRAVLVDPLHHLRHPPCARPVASRLLVFVPAVPSRRRDCHSAAPHPSPFSRRIHRDDEGVPAK